MKAPLLVGVLAVFLAAPASAGTASSLTVYAASSLKEVFPRIDAQPRYSVAGSDQLALQIREGAPADVFAAASPKYPQQLFAARLVERPVTFATNRLLVLVPRSNPARIRSVTDLARPGIKLVIGDAGVPIGDYTRRVLARLGLTRALRNVVSEEPDAKGIVGKVVLGQADAGVVYVTDAKRVARQTSTVAIPRRGQPAVRYEIAVVRDSRQLGRARAFVRLVLSPAGRRQLAAAGFGLPE